MMRADVVAHEREGAAALIHLPIQRVPKGHAFPLSLPSLTVPIDRARTGVKGRKKSEGTRALLLGLMPVGDVLRLGGQGGGATRARLQGGLLIHGEH